MKYMEYMFKFKNKTLLLLFHMSRFNICYLNVGEHVHVACICIIIVDSFETLIIAINILNIIYQ